jgi:predicted esterase
MDWAPPLFPPSLQSFFGNARKEGVWAGKRILTIHGGEDTLVPYAIGREEIYRVKQEVESDDQGQLRVEVMPGLGHVVTIDMVKMTAEWIWKYCLTSRS